MGWFGPKGFKTKVNKHELKPGGMLHSCLTAPDGSEMWGKFVYRDIKAPERLAWMHSFSDAAGGITRHPMSPAWPLEMITVVTLEDMGEKTKLTLTWQPMGATEEEVKTFADGMASMNGGWSGSFDALDGYLAGIKDVRKPASAG